MGNQHSEAEVPKKSELAGLGPNLGRRSSCADKPGAAALSEKPVLYNTPYLTVMFERLAEESRALDPGIAASVVSQTVFERVFSGPLNKLGKMLYEHICRGHKSPQHCISRDEFLLVATEILSLMLVHQQMSFYFKLFTRSSPDGMRREDAECMIMVCYTVSLACAYMPFDPTPTDLKILKAFTTSLIVDDKPVDEEAFTTWCVNNCPNLFNGVHCFLLIRLSGSNITDLGWHQRVSQATGGDSSAAADGSRSAAAAQQPQDAAADINEGVSLLRAVASGASAMELSLVWLLSCALPTCYLTPPPSANRLGSGAWAASAADSKRTHETQVPAAAMRGGAFVPSFLVSKLHQIVEHNPWTELYNSDRDGLSTNRFETHVLSYKGPTVTLVTFGSNLYVIACDEEWRESSLRFGKDDAMLVQLLPRFAIVKSGPGLLFMNHHNRGSPKGIFVGGKDGGKSLVLHIDEMTRVKHYGVDLPLQQVEVWGCASTEVRDIQVRQKQWEHREADKLSNRKLKFEAWEDNPDRQLLSWAGINTNHAEKT